MKHTFTRLFAVLALATLATAQTNPRIRLSSRSANVASGTAALGTTAIASTACATVVTKTATGVLTTDTVTWGYNADVSAITGYAPATAGRLLVLVYPTANAINFKVCNPTSGSITPGAVTLNYRVAR